MKPTSINNGRECVDEQPEIKDLYILPYKSRMEEIVHLLIKSKNLFCVCFLYFKKVNLTSSVPVLQWHKDWPGLQTKTLSSKIIMILFSYLDCQE